MTLLIKENVPQVYLVEDDVPISQALEALFASVKIRISSFQDPVIFLEKFYQGLINYGCIILDIRLTNMSGLELQEKLNEAKNFLPIIFITAYGEIEMVVKAMKSGAFDFVTKPFSNQKLISIVQQSFYHLEKNILLLEFKKNLCKLTNRESEILSHIIEGKMNKEISYDLNIAVSTVEIHRSSIMKKLGVRNAAKLINYYLLSQNL